jgi:membrane protein implicated in regulation of membrane protease activity
MDFITLAPPLLKTFWYIAIFATVVFAALMLMAAVGGGDSHDFDSVDVDADVDHGGADFQIFSFRNLINFLLGFSWSGIGLYHHISSKPALIVIALSVGAAMVYFFFQMMQAVVRLGRDQTVKPEEAAGKTGQVYLTIPARRSGKGKILISLGGATREFDAVTDGDTLPNGTQIIVTEVLEETLMAVEAS